MEHAYKDKSKLNLSLDIIMLLLIMPIVGIGFLIKYVLIPGIQRNALNGSNIDLEFWGLSRHQWGTIHLILSIVFMALLVLHVVLHWNMIVCIFRRMIPYKTLRITFAGLLTAVGLLLVSFPLVVKPEIVDREPLHQNRNNRNINLVSGLPETNKLSKHRNIAVLDSNNENSNNQYNDSANEEYEVYGSQTLQFVADKYNVPASKIAADLKIPVLLTGEKLGRLKKRYSFTMDAVKNSISNFKKRGK